MPTYAALTWDQPGERWYENGIDHGVLYPVTSAGTYGDGIAWNGLTGVDNNNDGADATDLWADNIKYATLRSAENFKITIKAYTYPDEFAALDGMATGAPGLYVGQQPRGMFGFVYRTRIANDTQSETDDGFKLHLCYGLTCSPSQKNYETVNDNPDAIEFSWDCEGVPVTVTGHKPTCELIIDSRTADDTKLTALMNTLFGSTTANASLPMPDDVIDALD